MSEEKSPTKISITDLKKTLEKLNNELTIITCFKCSKKFFPNFDPLMCDECYFSNFPEGT